MAQVALQESDVGVYGLLKTRLQSCMTYVDQGGQAIKVFCNYFICSAQPDWKLFQYFVKYLPPIESKCLRLRNHEATLFNNKAFD